MTNPTRGKRAKVYDRCHSCGYYEVPIPKDDRCEACGAPPCTNAEPRSEAALNCRHCKEQS